jgi:hypothetical protein
MFITANDSILVKYELGFIIHVFIVSITTVGEINVIANNFILYLHSISRFFCTYLLALCLRWGSLKSMHQIDTFSSLFGCGPITIIRIKFWYILSLLFFLFLFSEFRSSEIVKAFSVLVQLKKQKEKERKKLIDIKDDRGGTATWEAI